MARRFVTVVILSAASCVLTLVVTSVWLATVAQASAQRPPPIIQALGFEVVDVNGNRLAYFGEAQFSPAILTLGERNEVEMTVRSRVENQPRIQLQTADGATVWSVPPTVAAPAGLLGVINHQEYCQAQYGAESGGRASARILREGGYGCGWIPAQPETPTERRTIDPLAACQAAFGPSATRFVYTENAWECWS